MVMQEPAVQDENGFDTYVNGGVPSTSGPKIEVVSFGFTKVASNEADPGAATFCIRDEDHTLGNALRYIIMKNPAVEFCGYSIPHPSEYMVNLRIQTDGSISAVDALHRGLDDLINLTSHISTTFQDKVQAFK
ncbi:RNA polymerase subunit AC19 [Boothiomyces sp. JEL0866]|nr:RNA polymerase subunit AC19 [Boothiomyces sp. JEL0866]